MNDGRPGCRGFWPLTIDKYCMQYHQNLLVDRRRRRTNVMGCGGGGFYFFISGLQVILLLLFVECLSLVVGFWNTSPIEEFLAILFYSLILFHCCWKMDSCAQFTSSISCEEQRSIMSLPSHGSKNGKQLLISILLKLNCTLLNIINDTEL